MNIVVIMLDALRPDYLGCGGHTVIKTPNIDSVASQGAFFEHAYSEYPVSLPTRTALVSGSYTFTNRPWMPLLPSDLHIAEILKEKGYHTAAFADSPFGPQNNFDRGFQEFARFPCKMEPVPKGTPPFRVEVREAYFPPDIEDSKLLRMLWRQHAAGYLTYYRKQHGRIGADLLFDEAGKWLRRRGRQRKPFFLWIDSFQPHEPFCPPPPFDRMYQPNYTGRYIPLPAGRSLHWMTPEDLEHVRALYMGEVTLADAALGSFLSTLDQLGLSEETFLFIVSDHGMPLGEHGRILKGGVPVYDELARVTWLMRKPGLISAGIRASGLTQTTDLLPTILDVLGIEAPSRQVGGVFGRRPGLDGVSLRPLFSQESESVRARAYMGAFGLRAAIRTDRWKLIDNRGEKPNELFDLPSDPQEHSNLVLQEPELAQGLHRELWEFQKAWGVVQYTELLRPEEDRRGLRWTVMAARRRGLSALQRRVRRCLSILKRRA